MAQVRVQEKPAGTAKPRVPFAETQKQSITLADREEAANSIGQLLSFGSMCFGNLADAGAIGMHWPNIAHEAALVAENDEKMAKGLDYLLTVGPYGNLIVAMLPLVGQILVNHKVVRAETLAGAGVVSPDALEADVKAHLAKQAMEALQRQKEAEAELKAMAEEMATHANGQTAE